MSSILKYILFRTVLIVIVLHTIIPHPHSDELTEEKHFELHKKSNSLIGIIKLIFHENNDESIDNLTFAQIGSFKNTILETGNFKTFILHDFDFIVKSENENKSKKINVESACFNSNYYKSRKSRGPPHS